MTRIEVLCDVIRDWGEPMTIAELRAVAVRLRGLDEAAFRRSIRHFSESPGIDCKPRGTGPRCFVTGSTSPRYFPLNPTQERIA